MALGRSGPLGSYDDKPLQGQIRIPWGPWDSSPCKSFITSILGEDFFPGILLWDCTTPAFMYGTASDIFYTVGACTKVKTHIVIEPIEVVQFDTSY